MKIDLSRFFDKLFIYFIAFSSVSLTCYANNTQHEKFRKIIQETNIAMPSIIKNNDATGAAVAIVNKKGIIWSKGYGFLSKKKKIKVNKYTLYNVKLHIKNGYLYLDEYILTQFANNLFVSADGQVLDLTGKNPVWNNAGILKNKEY